MHGMGESYTRPQFLHHLFQHRERRVIFLLFSASFALKELANIQNELNAAASSSNNSKIPSKPVSFKVC
jgi:hypothetical protein